MCKNIHSISYHLFRCARTDIPLATICSGVQEHTFHWLQFASRAQEGPFTGRICSPSGSRFFPVRVPSQFWFQSIPFESIQCFKYSHCSNTIKIQNKCKLKRLGIGKNKWLISANSDKCKWHCQNGNIKRTQGLLFITSHKRLCLFFLSSQHDSACFILGKWRAG